jgi:ABC-2 type transport system ATP-binding protein
LIQIDQVSKFYDHKAAVDGIDLFVPRGSTFGLIGPNGAGKTTTLKMLATLIKPDAGRIAIDGLDLDRDAARIRRGIGYMPDSFGVFRGLSCQEYLEFFGRAYGLGGQGLSRRVEDVIDLTDLGGLRDEFTTALSFGMRQRLCLAKTLLHDPTLLVLDEPASGLDPRARIEIRSLLKELGAMGKTIVISSHILADLEEICSDIGIIEQGKVVWQGSLKTAAAEGSARLQRCAIQVPEAVAASAVELLGRLDFIAEAKLSGSEIRAELRGADSNQALAVLIQAGIEILAFKQEKIDLEALFLERTRGLVS